MRWTNLLFGPTGRINRQPFLLAGLALHVVLAVFVVAILNSPLMHYQGNSLSPLFPKPRPMLGFILIPFFIVFLWIRFALCAKRYHDLDQGSWNAVWCFLPVLGDCFLLFELCFFEGTIGPNQYGPDPLEPDFEDY